MTHKLISQGAEAKIFLTDELPTKVDGKTVHVKDKYIMKSRVVKSYRHPVIDEQLRKKRTRSEAKILQKAAGFGVHVPKVLKVDTYDLEIEFIDGKRLSENLHTFGEKEQEHIMEEMGKQTALLHKHDIIHGDLTTSNTLYKDHHVYIIDFGLGFFSTKLEDKAVDLHLIKQALEAKHYQNHTLLYQHFLKGYAWEDKEKVLKRLEAVEKRGRYRH